MNQNLQKLSFFKSLGFVENTSLFIESNFDKLGNFYKLNLPGHTIYVVIDPEVLQHVLIRNEENYHKSKIYWGELKKIVGDALGTVEGEEWLLLKKNQMQAYTHEKAEKYLDNVLKNSQDFYSQWANENKDLNIIHCFSELNVFILLNELFGYENAPLNELIASYISDGEEIISWRTKFPWRPFTAWINGRNHRTTKYINFFNNLAQQVIQERKQPKEELKKLIDYIIEQSDQIGDSDHVKQKKLRNEIIIHLGAGTETAAVGMGWILYLLHRHPQILNKVRTEVDDLLKGRALCSSDWKKLPYTEAVIKEALRLYPPSHAIIRDAQAEDNILGYPIQKGSTLFISAYGLHRNPRLWEKPNEFIPERFLIENPTQKYAYIPFGAGRHTCIGRYLAQPMMLLSLANFVHNYNFEIKVNEPLIPLSLSTLKPNQELKFKIQKR